MGYGYGIRNVSLLRSGLDRKDCGDDDGCWKGRRGRKAQLPETDSQTVDVCMYIHTVFNGINLQLHSLTGDLG